ncbi:MAG: hypothetical protein QXG35_10445 [Nitrososphaerota archaeon]
MGGAAEGVKLLNYVKARNNVFEFYRFYSKWLGSPLAERLGAEVYELMEEAISWWSQQLEVME